MMFLGSCVNPFNAWPCAVEVDEQRRGRLDDETTR